jgi:endoglucanase
MILRNKLFLAMASAVLFATCFLNKATAQKNSMVARTKGTQILDASGKPITLKGVNLGNWLVPEGYMFKTDPEVSAPNQIDQMLGEIIGPDSLANFWSRYLDNYITQADIQFLKRIGCNHIRLPFHYKMFTNDLYMGKRNSGFAYVDRIVNWCRQEKMYMLLDMHCAPGGQTGYNIDDSNGYPWLFFSKTSQDLMSEIWVNIAKHYKNEPVVIGYDLINEPLASYFTSKITDYNHRLFLLYQRMVADIRKVDRQHTIFLTGSLWAMDFRVFEKILDNNVVYEFHKYYFDVKQEAIQPYLDFRTKYNVPVYIGETGENSDEWNTKCTALLDSNAVNWAFWPYKKMDDLKGTMNFKMPADYTLISQYARSDRSNYEKMRNQMPDKAKVQKALDEFVENSLFKNNYPNKGYIRGLGFKVE